MPPQTVTSPQSVTSPEQNVTPSQAVTRSQTVTPPQTVMPEKNVTVSQVVTRSKTVTHQAVTPEENVTSSLEPTSESIVTSSKTVEYDRSRSVDENTEQDNTGLPNGNLHEPDSQQTDEVPSTTVESNQPPPSYTPPESDVQNVSKNGSSDLTTNVGSSDNDAVVDLSINSIDKNGEMSSESKELADGVNSQTVPVPEHEQIPSDVVTRCNVENESANDTEKEDGLPAVVCTQNTGEDQPLHQPEGERKSQTASPTPDVTKTPTYESPNEPNSSNLQQRDETGDVNKTTTNNVCEQSQKLADSIGNSSGLIDQSYQQISNEAQRPIDKINYDFVNSKINEMSSISPVAIPNISAQTMANGLIQEQYFSHLDKNPNIDGEVKKPKKKKKKKKVNNGDVLISDNVPTQNENSDNLAHGNVAFDGTTKPEQQNVVTGSEQSGQVHPSLSNDSEKQVNSSLGVSPENGNPVCSNVTTYDDIDDIIIPPPDVSDFKSVALIGDPAAEPIRKRKPKKKKVIVDSNSDNNKNKPFPVLSQHEIHKQMKDSFNPQQFTENMAFAPPNNYCFEKQYIPHEIRNAPPNTPHEMTQVPKSLGEMNSRNNMVDGNNTNTMDRNPMIQQSPAHGLVNPNNSPYQQQQNSGFTSPPNIQQQHNMMHPEPQTQYQPHQHHHGNPSLHLQHQQQHYHDQSHPGQQDWPAADASKVHVAGIKPLPEAKQKKKAAKPKKKKKAEDATANDAQLSEMLQHQQAAAMWAEQNGIHPAALEYMLQQMYQEKQNPMLNQSATPQQQNPATDMLSQSAAVQQYHQSAEKGQAKMPMQDPINAQKKDLHPGTVDYMSKGHTNKNIDQSTWRPGPGSMDASLDSVPGFPANNVAPELSKGPSPLPHLSANILDHLDISEPCSKTPTQHSKMDEGLTSFDKSVLPKPAVSVRTLKKGDSFISEAKQAMPFIVPEAPWPADVDDSAKLSEEVGQETEGRGVRVCVDGVNGNTDVYETKWKPLYDLDKELHERLKHNVKKEAPICGCLGENGRSYFLSFVITLS